MVQLWDLRACLTLPFTLKPCGFDDACILDACIHDSWIHDAGCMYDDWGYNTCGDRNGRNWLNNFLVIFLFLQLIPNNLATIGVVEGESDNF